jgi:penicillin-binding protein 2
MKKLAWEGNIGAEERFRRRINILWLGIICSFLFLLVKVGWLQLGEGERYRYLSENFRLQLLPLPAPRGLILDRNGRRLAENEACFSVAVVPCNVDDIDQPLDSLEGILNIDRQLAKRKIQEALNPFRPVALKRGVDMSTITFLLEREEEFPGMIVLVNPVRSYPYHEIASHLLGHIGEVSQEELSINFAPGVEAGDLVGKMGIERVCNKYLQGEKGGRQIEADAYGRPLRTISEKDASPGDNVYLTIDMKLQEIAESQLGKRKGVVIIGNPHTGEILALVSHPNFDPNLFARGISEEDWIRLKQDPEKPLQNRAVSGEYGPASTFKIIVTAAALETHKIDEGETLLCKGELSIGNRVFRCWKEEGHGKLNLEEAIIHSCDVFFYQLGLRVGVEKIIEFARLFGLGKPTGIDLVSEGRGFLPSSSWKLKNEGEPWYGGDTANLSIGQGYILVTPLQMLNVISAIANGGKLFRPYLVKKIVNSRRGIIKEFSPHRVGKVPLSSSTLSLLRRSLREVVKEGTGWRAENKVVKISGKTGTVELSGEEKPHNWFIGYAPSDNPSLSIVVLVEHREEDISIAAEIAGKILSQYFSEG